MCAKFFVKFLKSGSSLQITKPALNNQLEHHSLPLFRHATT